MITYLKRETELVEALSDSASSPPEAASATAPSPPNSCQNCLNSSFALSAGYSVHNQQRWSESTVRTKNVNLGFSTTLIRVDVRGYFQTLCFLHLACLSTVELVQIESSIKYKYCAELVRGKQYKHTISIVERFV